MADDEVCSFFLSLRRLAESRLAEVEQVAREYFEERGAMEAVPGDELLRRVRSGEVTVLDVRPPEEYRAGHIPGALSIPLGELKARLEGAAEGSRDRRLLPRALLRDGGRGRRAPPQEGLRGPPHGAGRRWTGGPAAGASRPRAKERPAHDSRSPGHPREPRAVLAARRRQRLRRRDGRHGAHASSRPSPSRSSTSRRRPRCSRSSSSSA